MHSNRDARWMSYIVEVNRPGSSFGPKQTVARNWERERRSPATTNRRVPSFFTRRVSFINTQRLLYKRFRSGNSPRRKDSRPAILTLLEEWTSKQQKFPKNFLKIVRIVIKGDKDTPVTGHQWLASRAGTPMSFLNCEWLNPT